MLLLVDQAPGRECLYWATIQLKDSLKGRYNQVEEDGSKKRDWLLVLSDKKAKMAAAACVCLCDYNISVVALGLDHAEFVQTLRAEMRVEEGGGEDYHVHPSPVVLTYTLFDYEKSTTHSSDTSSSSSSSSARGPPPRYSNRHSRRPVSQNLMKYSRPEWVIPGKSKQ
jgi:hypothetical protein